MFAGVKARCVAAVGEGAVVSFTGARRIWLGSARYAASDCWIICERLGEVSLSMRLVRWMLRSVVVGVAEDFDELVGVVFLRQAA